MTRTAIFYVFWVGDPCSKPNWNWQLALQVVGQRLSCPLILYFSLAWAFNESKILEKGKWHGPTHHEAAVSMQPTPDPFSWPLPLPFPSFPAAAWGFFEFPSSVSVKPLQLCVNLRYVLHMTSKRTCSLFGQRSEDANNEASQPPPHPSLRIPVNLGRFAVFDNY